MKKYALVLILAVLATACKKENEVESKVDEVPMPKVEIQRFDQLFFDAGPDGLAEVKRQFPELFPAEYNP